jgi:hypothetical protein
MRQNAQLGAARRDEEPPAEPLVVGPARVAAFLERYAASREYDRPEPAALEPNYYHRALAGLDPDRLTEPAREVYWAALVYADELMAYNEEIRVCLEGAREAAAAYRAWVMERRRLHEEAERLGDAAAQSRVAAELAAGRTRGTTFREDAARHRELARAGRAHLGEIGSVLAKLLVQLERERTAAAVQTS